MKLFALATLGLLATAVPVMAATGVMHDLGADFGLQTDHGSADGALDGSVNTDGDPGAGLSATAGGAPTVDTSSLPIDGMAPGGASATATASQGGASADVSTDGVDVGV